MCCVLGTVYWRRELSAGPACRPAGRDRGKFTPPVHSTQYTAHSNSTIKCNLSVTIKKVFPEDDPAGSKHVGVCYD
jgi:hypothetical protein